jgi:hypothetical protein
VVGGQLLLPYNKHGGAASARDFRCPPQGPTVFDCTNPVLINPDFSLQIGASGLRTENFQRQLLPQTCSNQVYPIRSILSPITRTLNPSPPPPHPPYL